MLSLKSRMIDKVKKIKGGPISLPLDHKLSENFTYGEVIKSSTAARAGIKNIPNKLQFSKLKVLVQEIMQPLRGFLGVPVVVTSGFRCIKLNRLKFSPDHSQHPKGEAIDFVVPLKKLIEIWKWIAASSLDFDRCILEHNEWIHISYSKGNNRHLMSYTIWNEDEKKVKYINLSKVGVKVFKWPE